MRVVMKFNSTVNRMHYGDEPEEEAQPGATSDGDAEEGNAQGNAA
jgi:hypothetical protein